MKLKKWFVDFLKSAENENNDIEKAQPKGLILFILILSAFLVCAIVFNRYNS